MERVKYNVNEDCVKQEDFADIFKQISKHIVNERHEGKRKIFKNIFEHTITSSKYDFDETEHFMNILGQLTLLQISVLVVLYDPEKYNEMLGGKVHGPEDKGLIMLNRTCLGGEVLMELLNKKDYEIRSAVSFLYYNGFVNDGLIDFKLITNSNPIHVLDDQLTPLGSQFMKYILNEQL